jgi:hypothetical protein
LNVSKSVSLQPFNPLTVRTQKGPKTPRDHPPNRHHLSTATVAHKR